MTWSKIDDRLHSHPKARKAGLEAMGLWALCLSFCGAYQTDGQVTREDVESLGGRKGGTLATRLVAAGLWVETPEGWGFHDYLAYNPSAVEVASERQRKAEAGRRGGIAKARAASTSPSTSLAPASPVLPEPALLPIPSRPVPSRPVPSRPGGDSAPTERGAGPPARPSARTERGGGEGRAETPVERAWRTWRAAYQSTYRRAYPHQSTDGPAMQRAAKGAVELCSELGKAGDEHLEALLTHRWRKYLADPGQSRQPGGPGYLRETCHRLQDFERGVAAYGTPWDRERKADAAPAGPREHSGKCKPGRCVCALGAEAPAASAEPIGEAGDGLRALLGGR